MKNKWKPSKHFILGLPAEELRSPNYYKVGGYHTEYRLKNHNADIWQFAEHYYAAIIKDRNLFITLANRFPYLGNRDLNNVPYNQHEEFLIYFWDKDAPTILSMLEFSPPTGNQLQMAGSK